jgi:serine protease Do
MRLESSEEQAAIAKPNRTLRLPTTITYLFLPILGGVIALTGNYFLVNQRLVPTANAQTSIVAPNTSTTPSISNNPTNFVIDVVKRDGAAVVRIDSSRTVTSKVPDYFNDPFFREFFGSQFSQVPEKRVQRGMGSGFIISDDGKILTNAHVVDGADSVTVTLKDGRTLQGKVMGTDPVTDVAVIKVEAKDLPTVKLGNSENIQTGEWAIAIGNPLGLDNTVTTGIISATARNSSQIGISDKRVEFIQTDAAINPGNSGGPLLNAKGEVIGINTAIIQNAQGLGFAIPINKALNIAEQLIANGKVEHPFLGIRMVALTPEIKQQLQQDSNLEITQDKGILVVRVMRDSPAATAGLRPGDVIESVNGEVIKDANRIQKLVEDTKIGNSLNLSVNRNGDSRQIEVKIGTLPTETASKDRESSP